MPRVSHLAAAALVAAGVMFAAAPGALAQCHTIGGLGTASDVEGAKFQAYEAMLQGTSWPMWAQWMASGANVGTAPGYTVKGLRFRCKPGGSMGQECRGQATFCK